MKSSPPFPTRVLAATVIALAAMAAVATHAAAPARGGIAWQVASSDAEVDKAFAAARTAGRPVYLYWGAVWCPPCNQVKATLFNRPDFIERSKAFVPVYVDGDKPGAQKVAARFKVSGYPTMILFKPDGTEITRLPGEVDPERYLLALTTGLEAQVSAKELITRAVAGQALTPEQWRLLAYYSWDTDEQQAVPTAQLPDRLAKLAAAVPADLPALRDRIALKGLAAAARGGGAAAEGSAESGRKLVDRILADPVAAKSVYDVLIGYGETLTKYLASGEARKQLATRWDAALTKAMEDPAISRGERVDALDTRVALWKLANDPNGLDAARREIVKLEMARLVTATTDRYERQAVVPSAAHVLAQAGLLDDSDALLKAELPKAVAPYYHMLGLAGNAKKRNDPKAALDWYEQAWRKSEGPATRIQWGGNYLGQIVELTPTDAKRIEAAGSALLAQLQPKGETFYERNQRSLQRAAKRLKTWQGEDPARAKVVARLKSQLDKTCAKLPAKDAGRANCEKVFSPDAT